MGKPLVQSIAIAMVTVLGGCSGKEAAPSPSSDPGGVSGVGGHTQGGTISSGGTWLTGGSRAIGGQSTIATGGASEMGGTRSTGGSVGGETTAVGGAPSTGGTAIAGGAGNSGAASANGGMPYGGSIATGGTLASGGVTLTGGTAATGGRSSTGGSFSTGGATTIWPKKFCGNISTDRQVDPTGLSFVKHWDQLTPENAGKWGSVQSSASGAFNWATLDTFYAHAEQNGIIFKEYTLVWGAGNPVGAQVDGAVENWIKAICERYPKVALIDVVNEPPPHTTPTFTATLSVGETGSYPWITKSFKLARKYCGNAVLILNDYNNIEYASQQSHFIDIVKDIQAAGAPIDAIGAQAHYAYQFTASQIQTNLDTLYAQTGLPIYITEYDVGKALDAEQLDIISSQFPVFWNASYVRGVTMWGWISGHTWIANSGLVNGTTPRPAMTWLMGYLGRASPP